MGSTATLLSAYVVAPCSSSSNCCCTSCCRFCCSGSCRAALPVNIRSFSLLQQQQKQAVDALAFVVQ